MHEAQGHKYRKFIFNRQEFCRCVHKKECKYNLGSVLVDFYQKGGHIYNYAYDSHLLSVGQNKNTVYVEIIIMLQLLEILL